LRFEEELLTDGKADPCHMNTAAFGNLMLRIPGSLNSNQVRFNEKGESFHPKSTILKEQVD